VRACRAAIVGSLAALLNLCLVQPLHAAPLRVGIVHGEAREAYHAFASQLRDELAGRDDIRLISVDASPEQADMLVAVGARAASQLSHASVPVLHVMTSRSALAAQEAEFSGRHAAIYLDQPVLRQLDLVHVALPQARSIGVLVSSPPEELGELRLLAKAMGLTLQVQTVAEPSGLADHLNALLDVSDVLLVLPDANIYRPDSIRNILLTTYRKRVPMIGLSQSYVQAGALCAVYSTPSQIAHQAALAIVHYQRTGRLPENSYPQDFEVAVNIQVARSLGLTIKSAQQLRDEVRGK